MANDVVFILSLAHSGSTVLDLILGGHPRFVGLGEIVHLLRPQSVRMLESDPRWLDRADEVRCSCGKAVGECEFWGPALAELRSNRQAGPRERYALLLKVFGEVFGEDRVFLDSSKQIENLELVRGIEGVNVKVLMSVRDVRGFTTSALDALKREKTFGLAESIRKLGWRGAIKYPRRFGTFMFWRWYHRNRKRKAYLQRSGLPVFQFGYEELALYPDRMIPKICEFLGVEPTDEMYCPAKSNSHSILGNRMRLQKDKLARIAYDNRWFRRTEWMLPWVLYPHIRRYNTREVYRNTSGAIWKQ